MGFKLQPHILLITIVISRSIVTPVDDESKNNGTKIDNLVKVEINQTNELHKDKIDNIHNGNSTVDVEKKNPGNETQPHDHLGNTKDVKHDGTKNETSEVVKDKGTEYKDENNPKDEDQKHNSTGDDSPKSLRDSLNDNSTKIETQNFNLTKVVDLDSDNVTKNEDETQSEAKTEGHEHDSKAEHKQLNETNAVEQGEGATNVSLNREETKHDDVKQLNETNKDYPKQDGLKPKINYGGPDDVLIAIVQNLEKGDEQNQKDRTKNNESTHDVGNNNGVNYGKPGGDNGQKNDQSNIVGGD